jgi:NAD(P)-dependent dehydrogenase (short-subunit alcohol dehydrogenase family)
VAAIPLHERLDGQVALVSGANRGLGAAVADGLAALGATVYAGTRDLEALAGVEEASDGRVRAVALDVTSEGAVRGAVALAVAEAGRLDILVNNAGAGDFGGRDLLRLETSLLDQVLATNLRGPMLLARAALPHLLARPGGRVVNVSSGMGQLSRMGPTAPAYRVTKAGLNALTAYLHAEYGAHGLLASSACPGWVRTRMGGDDAPRTVAQGADTLLWLCRLAPGAPGGRFWRDRQEIPW